jgi:imidazoleglycerol-phosphate dehydratase / histidinol-phosphatase
MRKILFIDRDGTIIDEPKPSLQIDSLEKLAFLPGAIYALARLVRETDYELVMVTNQDGLGTDSFPEHTFWPAHQKMMDTLASAGIRFKEVLIDRSFEQENLPTRKPGTAMLTHYMDGSCDLANSYVIGDRLTDVKLAQNLGCQAIYLQHPDNPDPTGQPNLSLATDNWEAIYRHLRLPDRRIQHRRTTRETDIFIEMNLDGTGQTNIKTGLHFFDHMLDQLGRHGNMDLHIEAKGDLHIDEHHTIEDTGIALGEAFRKALADKRGMNRYGFEIMGDSPAAFLLPMDDALAWAALDFGGRAELVWKINFERERIGDVPTEMFRHFFKSFADAAQCNINLRVKGDNEHHKIEAAFKAFAKAIRLAVHRDPNSRQLPSTKGLL